MQYKRSDRVGELIAQEISQILLREIKDPRIGFVTITGVEITADLQHATVFFSVLGENADKDKTFQGLRSATGFIRNEIGKRIRLRLTPEITFKLDNSIEEGARINQLINNLEKK